MNYISTSKAISELLENYNRLLAWICNRRDEASSPPLQSLWKSVLNDAEVRRDALVDFLRRSEDDVLLTQLQYGRDAETFDRAMNEVLASRPQDVEEAAGALAAFYKTVADYLRQLSEVAEATQAKEPLRQLAEETEATAASESWRFRSPDDGLPSRAPGGPDTTAPEPGSHAR